MPRTLRHPNQDPRDLNVEHYPDGFWLWIDQPANQRLYREFERKALRLARSGKAHWTSRQIIETIRCEMRLADTDKQFKINDHNTPGMARLWMATHAGDYPGFFHLKPALPSASDTPRSKPPAKFVQQSQQLVFF